MSTDQRWRSTERELAATPEDAAGWLRLSHAQERSGDLAGAGVSTVRAASHGVDPEVVGQARRLGWEGFWPVPAGPGGRRQSPLPGPAEGVLRWRQALPRRVRGTPLLAFDGTLTLVGASAGLVQRGPDGTLRELSDWNAWLRPTLFRDAPGGLDPARLAFARGAVWEAALAPGRIYASDGRTLLALSDEAYVLWRIHARLDRLEASPLGPVLLRTQLAQAPWVGALDAEGEPRFRHELPRSQREAGLAASSRALAVAGAGGLMCLDPHDGELLWQTNAEASTELLALDEARLYVGHRLQGVGARLLAGGAACWSRPDLRGATGLLRDGEDALLVLRDAEVLSLDASSGETRWALPLSPAAPLSGIALGPGGVAYVVAGVEVLGIG